MEKEIHNIFQNDNGISLNEYDVDKILGKKIFIPKDNLPKIDIGEIDDSMPELLDNMPPENTDANKLMFEPENDNNETVFNLDISNIEDMNLIQENVEEYVPLESDLIKEDNLKEKEKAEYDIKKEIELPEIDDSDYIDDPNYSTAKNSYDGEEIIKLSGNELDVITNYANTVKYDERYHELEQAVRYEEAFKESDDTSNIDKETWIYNNKNCPRKKFTFEWEFKKIPPILSYDSEESLNDTRIENKEEDIIFIDEDTLTNLETEEIIEEEPIIIDEEALKSLDDDDKKEETISIDEDTLTSLETEEIIEEEPIIIDEEVLKSLDDDDKKEETISIDEDTLTNLETEEIIEEEPIIDKDMPANHENEESEKDIIEVVEDDRDINDLEKIVLEESNEHIEESDLEKLEEAASKKNNMESEEGDELITIYSKRKDKQKDKKNKKHIESIESFDAKDDLLNEESPVPEEKELESVSDAQSTIDNEFTLEDSVSVDIDIKPNTANYNDNEDFDGEITQSDLDKALKLYESEGDGDKNLNITHIKSNELLSDEDRIKCQKLFSYFKSIVENLPEDILENFSKTEFYDAYSSLLRKIDE